MHSRRILTGSLLIIVMAAMVLMIFAGRQRSSNPPLPSPNGYLNLISAGERVASDTSDYKELSEESLRELVAQNKEATHLVRLGLSRECRVPVAYSMEYLADHLEELGSLKHAAQALAAEGRLYELLSRNGDAAKVYLDAVRFGQEIRRGGVIIDTLVGMACAAMGLNGLETLLPKLDATECRMIIDAWRSLESDSLSFEEVLRNENEWTRRSYPFYYRVPLYVTRLLHGSFIRQTEQRVLKSFRDEEDRRRKLLLQLATRAYELEKGKSPENIALLVPDYLKEIPLGHQETQANQP